MSKQLKPLMYDGYETSNKEESDIDDYDDEYDDKQTTEATITTAETTKIVIVTK